jgi:hypothetical protein
VAGGAVFLQTGLTNARTEGTNRLIKQVSAICARPAGSVMWVKQLPCLPNAIPATWAWAATYSWLLRMICARTAGNRAS